MFHLRGVLGGRQGGGGRGQWAVDSGQWAVTIAEFPAPIRAQHLGYFETLSLSANYPLLTAH